MSLAVAAPTSLGAKPIGRMKRPPRSDIVFEMPQST